MAQDFGSWVYDDAQNVVIAKTPEMQKAFQDLQFQLNRFASIMGFPLLVVDGIIGDNTINAAFTVAGHIANSAYGQGNQAPGSAALLSDARSPISVAQRYDMLAVEASAVGDAESLPYDINPAQASPAGRVSDRKPQMILQPPVAAADPSWMWWVGGAAVALGSFFAAYALWKVTRKAPRLAPA